MWKRAVQTVTKIRHTAACVCPACHASQLRTLFTVSSAHACRAVPAARSSSRLLHSSAVRSAKQPAEDDLDDLFGEEMNIAQTPAAASSSSASSSSSSAASATPSTPAATNLSSLLASTRRSTAASLSAASDSSASSVSRGAAGAAEGLVLLDPANPPRLEGRHFALLKSAAKDLGSKVARVRKEAKEAALAQGMSDAQAEVEADASPRLAALKETEARIAQLCRQLFPPENSAGLDDRRVGELLDYAEAMPGVMHLVQPDAVDPMKLMAFDQKTTRSNRHQFCLFCKPSTAMLERNTLVYTNLNLLTQFLNLRGMIIQRDESRLCMKHQRAVARTIKQARSIGLLSPMSNWRVPADYVYGTSGSKFSAKQAAEIAAGGDAAAVASNGPSQAAPSSFDLSAFDDLASFAQSQANAAGTEVADEDDFTDAQKPSYRTK